MTLGEAEAKPKTPAKKPQVSVPEPPAEAEPDPVLDPMPEEELEGWQERSCPCCKSRT